MANKGLISQTDLVERALVLFQDIKSYEEKSALQQKSVLHKEREVIL